MSFSDNAPQVRGEEFYYGELEGQQVAGSWLLDFQARNGQDLPPTGFSHGRFWNEMPVAGGLDRNQAAELAAFRVSHFRATFVEEGNSGTTPGTFHIDAEIETNQTAFQDRQVGNVMSVDTNPVFSGEDPIDDDFTSVNANTWMDGTSLWWGILNGYTGFNDTVNGTGGGGHNPHYNGEIVDYRQKFVRGPIWLGRDDPEVTANYALKWMNIENQRLDAKLVAQFWWDVFELDEGPMQLVEA